MKRNTVLIVLMSLLLCLAVACQFKKERMEKHPAAEPPSKVQSNSTPQSPVPSKPASQSASKSTDHFQVQFSPDKPEYNWNQFSVRRHDYFKRLFDKELQKTQSLNPEVQAYADRFCAEIFKPGRATFNENFYHTADRAVLRSLYETGERLIKDGEAHPVLYYGQMEILRWCEDDVFPFDRNPVRRRIAETGYEACQRVEGIHPFFPYVFSNEIRQRVPKTENQKWIDEMHRLLPQIMYPENMQESDFDVVANLLYTFFRHNYYLENRRIAADILMNDPKVPKWFGLYSDGNVHIDEAWAARGGGWASSVTDEGWTGFNDHLSQARESLTKAWTLRPDLPEAARKMIEVAKGDSHSRKEAREWFNRSIAARIDYCEAYNSYIHCLTPRWGGSVGRLQSFANECLQTDRFDTCMPWYGVAPVLGWICREAGYPDMLPHPERSLEMIRGLYQGYRVADNLTGDNRAAVFSSLAAFAFKAGDSQLAHQILSEVSYTNYPEYLEKYIGASFRDYVWQSWFSGSPAAGLIQEAVALGKAGKIHDAMIAYDRILEDSTIPVEARDQLVLQKYTLEFSEQFKSGGWADVYNGDSRPAWVSLNKYWTSDADGFLKADQMRSLGWLPAEVSFVDGFELKLDLELPPGGVNSDRRVCIFFADPAWHSYNCAYVQLDCGKNKLTLYPGRDGEDGTEKSELCKFTGKDHVRVTVKDGSFTVDVNGSRIISNFPVDKHPRYKGTMRVGLGDYWDGRFSEITRFNNIRIRKVVTD